MLGLTLTALATTLLLLTSMKKQTQLYVLISMATNGALKVSKIIIMAITLPC